MEIEKKKPVVKRRSIGTGGLRARAGQYADDALAALKDVAASPDADPQARVDAAKSIIGYSMAGKDV